MIKVFALFLCSSVLFADPWVFVSLLLCDAYKLAFWHVYSMFRCGKLCTVAGRCTYCLLRKYYCYCSVEVDERHYCIIMCLCGVVSCVFSCLSGCLRYPILFVCTVCLHYHLVSHMRCWAWMDEWIVWEVVWLVGLPGVYWMVYWMCYLIPAFLQSWPSSQPNWFHFGCVCLDADLM